MSHVQHGRFSGKTNQGRKTICDPIRMVRDCGN